MDRSYAAAELDSEAKRDVAVRSDASAVDFLHRNQAVAATIDHDTIFVAPEHRESRTVMSHELAHIAQLRSGMTASREAAEAHAASVAAGTHAGSLHGTGAAAPPMFQTVDPIAHQVTDAATNGAVFDVLRGAPRTIAGDAAVAAAIANRFRDMPDDLWLATQLQAQGPEPLWDTATVAERARRAAANRWAGNIGADLTNPADPAHTVRAYFFPGTVPDLRALVFAGVHESEPEGTAVAERLRTRLAADSAAGRPPTYSVIVVPNLFENRHLEVTAAGSPVPLADRRKINHVDPNRNFPGDVRPGLRGGSDTPRDAGPRPGRAIFTENRILMALVERFRPQRVASIHAHSLKNVQGDAPGIFVDPRSLTPEAGEDSRHAKVRIRDAWEEDFQLATDMIAAAHLPAATAASTDPHVNPFIGNFAQHTAEALRNAHGRQTIRPRAAPNVIYDPDAPTASTGISAGGWFPNRSDVPPATPGAARTTRDPVAIYTVEVPEWRSRADAPNLPAIEELEARVLQEIFLGAPARP